MSGVFSLLLICLVFGVIGLIAANKERGERRRKTLRQSEAAWRAELRAVNADTLPSAAFVAMNPPNLPPFGPQYYKKYLQQKNPKNQLGKAKTLSSTKRNRQLLDISNYLRETAAYRVSGEFGKYTVLQGQAEGLIEASTYIRNNIK